MGNAIFRSAKKRLLHVRFGHVSLTQPYSTVDELPASTVQFWPNCAGSVLIHVNTLDSLVRARVRVCAGAGMYRYPDAPSTVVVCIHCMYIRGGECVMCTSGYPSCTRYVQVCICTTLYALLCTLSQWLCHGLGALRAVWAPPLCMWSGMQRVRVCACS